MSNSIGLVTKYLPILDEVYKQASKTAILDAPGEKVRFTGAHTVEIFKTAMQGLGNYSRNSGFVTGDVTASWESFTLQWARGRSFTVDALDDEESLGMAFGTLVPEFIRTQLVPEMDAVRLATYASKSGILSANKDLAASDDIPGIIDTAVAAMSNEEVPEEGRILFVSEDCYKLLKGDITRYVANSDRDVNRTIEIFDNMQVIKVPQTRFNTSVTLYDGSTSGQEAGGYIVPAGSYKINFMIVHPSAVLQVVKRAIPRIFTPEQNINADGFKFDYRIEHGADVEANKVKGIYLHRAATANS